MKKLNFIILIVFFISILVLASEEPKIENPTFLNKIEKSIYYITRKGDTLKKISKIKNVSLEDLKNYNPEIGSGLLIAGKKLKIASSKGVEYEVKKGENLIKVAKKFNISINDIKKFNEIKNSKLSLGQILFIPCEDETEIPITQSIEEKIGEKIIGDSNYPTKYEEYVEKYSKEYNVNKYLIYSIIKEESGFDPNNISYASACGLMQVVVTTARLFDKSITKKELLNPEVNIKIGTQYLRYLLDKFDNNVKVVVAAYNAGETNVVKWLNKSAILDVKKIPFMKTRSYVKKVLKNLDKYKVMGNDERLG